MGTSKTKLDKTIDNWREDPKVVESLNFLKKKYKREFFKSVKERDYSGFHRLPFGVFPLDAATGGGVPVGKVTLMWGPQGSCKTTLAGRVVANALQTDRRTKLNIIDFLAKGHSLEEFRPMRCAWLDIENSFDVAWMCDKHGIDEASLIYEKVQHSDECLDIIECFLRSESIDLLVVDSIAAIVPYGAMFEDDNRMLLHPKAVNQIIGRMTAAMIQCSQKAAEDESGEVAVPTVILINQQREKPSHIPSASEYAPGGRAPGHAASLEIKLKPMSAKAPTNKFVIGNKADDNTIAKNCVFKYYIPKNRTYTPHRGGKFKMRNLSCPDTGIPQGYMYVPEDIIKFASTEDIIGSDIGWELAGKSFKTKKELTEALEDSEYLHQAYNFMLDKIVPKYQ